MKNGLLKRFLPPIIALAGGILFIVLGCVGISQAKNFPEVEATVVSVEENTSIDTDGTTTTDVEVVVSYTVDGVSYEELLSDAPSKLKENDKITVRYNPEKPSSVTATTKKAGIFRIVFGAFFTVVGLALFAKILIKGQ